MNVRPRTLTLPEPRDCDDVAPENSYPNVPLRMSQEQIEKGLNELATARACGNLSGHTLNALITKFARQSGHSYLFLKANTNARVDEMRRRWGRQEKATE